MRRRPTTLAVVGALLLGACSAGGDGDEVRSLARAPEEQHPAPTSSTTEAEAPEPVATTAPPASPAARPVAAGDPAGLAAQIVESEGVIADLSAAPADLAAAGHLQQVAYRALAAKPEWDAEVERLLPEELRPVAAANVAAGRELRQLVRTPRENLPAWRIVEPAPADELRRYYEEGQAAFGVPWQYLAAVHLAETRMGRIRGVSTAGAQGPMQFLPSTWEAYGEGDINDNHDAILSAARYLAANQGDCRPGAPCNLANALYRYNPTPRYVNAVTAYAERMRADERAYRGYYHWQVYYVTVLGDVWLRVGYEATEERPVTPDDLG